MNYYRDAAGFIFAGLGLAAIASWQSFHAYSSGSWPSTRGRIVRSSVESGTRPSGSSGQTSAAAVSYEYQVDGKTYQGDVVRFGQIFTRSSSRSEAAARRHAIGPAEIYYNPRSPSQAVLEPGLHSDNLLLPIVSCVFIGVGVVLIVAKKRQNRRVAEIKARQNAAKP